MRAAIHDNCPKQLMQIRTALDRVILAKPRQGFCNTRASRRFKQHVRTWCVRHRRHNYDLAGKGINNRDGATVAARRDCRLKEAATVRFRTTCPSVPLTRVHPKIRLDVHPRLAVKSSRHLDHDRRRAPMGDRRGYLAQLSRRPRHRGPRDVGELSQLQPRACRVLARQPYSVLACG